MLKRYIQLSLLLGSSVLGSLAIASSASATLYTATLSGTIGGSTQDSGSYDGPEYCSSAVGCESLVGQSFSIVYTLDDSTAVRWSDPGPYYYLDHYSSGSGITTIGAITAVVNVAGHIYSDVGRSGDKYAGSFDYLYQHPYGSPDPGIAKFDFDVLDSINGPCLHMAGDGCVDHFDVANVVVEIPELNGASLISHLGDYALGGNYAHTGTYNRTIENIENGVETSYETVDVEFDIDHLDLAVVAVTEPPSWINFLAGLGALAVLCSRRKCLGHVTFAGAAGTLRRRNREGCH